MRNLHILLLILYAKHITIYVSVLFRLQDDLIALYVKIILQTIKPQKAIEEKVYNINQLDSCIFRISSTASVVSFIVILFMVLNGGNIHNNGINNNGIWANKVVPTTLISLIVDLDFENKIPPI